VDNLLVEAHARFREFHGRLQDRGVREPDAMTLSTCGADGRPTSRVVLMRGHDERGFVFFTNSLSRKGRQMDERPFAAICFYDDAGAEQVRIEGRVEVAQAEVTDAYWARRPRGSRIGAWASQQSDRLADRDTLVAAVAEFEKKFESVEQVPRPDHWLGYRVVPDRVEFWKGQPSRLHDREVYELVNGQWIKYRLFP
jgi:pyridoxamine 5'-phosphate oxidase